jgi:hypothetical protein
VRSQRLQCVPSSALLAAVTLHGLLRASVVCCRPAELVLLYQLFHYPRLALIGHCSCVIAQFWAAACCLNQPYFLPPRCMVPYIVGAAWSLHTVHTERVVTPAKNFLGQMQQGMHSQQATCNFALLICCCFIMKMQSYCC